MKKILFPILLLGLSGFFFQSCEDEMDLAPDEPNLYETRGATVSATAPNIDFNTSILDESLEVMLTTIGESVSSFQVFKRINNGDKVEVGTYTSTPVELSFTLEEAIEGTGLTLEDLEDGDEFILSYENVETASGSYNTATETKVSIIKCPIRVPGTYNFVSTDYFCGDTPLEGSVTISEVGPGVYVFDDFAFGTYQECYGGPAAGWGTLEVTRFQGEGCNECSLTEECNSLLYQVRMDTETVGLTPL